MGISIHRGGKDNGPLDYSTFMSIVNFCAHRGIEFEWSYGSYAYHMNLKTRTGCVMRSTISTEHLMSMPHSRLYSFIESVAEGLEKKMMQEMRYKESRDRGSKHCIPHYSDVTNTSGNISMEYYNKDYLDKALLYKGKPVNKPKNMRELLQADVNKWLKGIELPKRRLAV